MPTVCIQCAMQAMVKGEPPTSSTFDETIEQHMARCHPDPLATYRERQMLEAAIAKMLDKGPAVP